MRPDGSSRTRATCAAAQSLAVSSEVIRDTCERPGSGSLPALRSGRRSRYRRSRRAGARGVLACASACSCHASAGRSWFDRSARANGQTDGRFAPPVREKWSGERWAISPSDGTRSNGTTLQPAGWSSGPGAHIPPAHPRRDRARLRSTRPLHPRIFSNGRICAVCEAQQQPRGRSVGQRLMACKLPISMGDPGLEPGTSSLSEKRSNRLS